MGKFVDMTGWKMWEHGVFDSRLTVIERAEDYISPRGIHRIMWKCECSCSEHGIVVTSTDQLKSGRTKSCGCLHKEFLNILHENNRKQCKYDVDSFNYGIGWTTNTNREFYFDLEDYDKIKNFYWENNHGYAVARIYKSENQEYIYMHRLILDAKDGEVVDHINRNRLNNLKNNLRITDNSGNARNTSLAKNNTSGVIGVTLDRRNSRWIAQITVHYQNKRLGSFSSKKDAIRARLQAEAKYFKEFSPQRHLFKEYGIEDNFLEE